MTSALDLDQWETLACPICRHPSFDPLFEKDGEPFVACRQCELILINPRPVMRCVLSTYNEDYSRHYMDKAAKKLRRCRRWVRRIQRNFVSHGRWLDVGCSAGFVVKAAHDGGFQAFGLDVEPSGIGYAREVFGLDGVACGMLEDQHYPDAHFQVISLYDVIEHVPDLNGLVAELKRLLDKNGVIEIRTPDAGHWRVPRDLSQWREIKPSEHLYYFTRRTLDALLRKHSLRIAARRLSLKPGLKVYIRHA